MVTHGGECGEGSVEIGFTEAHRGDGTDLPVDRFEMRLMLGAYADDGWHLCRKVRIREGKFDGGMHRLGHDEARRQILTGDQPKNLPVIHEGHSTAFCERNHPCPLLPRKDCDSSRPTARFKCNTESANAFQIVVSVSKEIY